MKNYLISMFIDNELDIDEKIYFVQAVHDEKSFLNEAIDLLEQEKQLCAKMVDHIPRVHIPIERVVLKSLFVRWLRPLILCTTGLAFAVAIIFIQRMPVPVTITSNIVSREIPYRFVIYRPGAEKADIIGTFTQWQPVAMKKMGSSGYWSLTLNLSEGEYQYSYLVEEGKQIADPTVSERVHDDFGGENSLITIKV